MKTKFIREIAINYTGRTTPRTHIGSADNIATFIRSALIDNSREQFIVIYLNGAHDIIAYSIVSVGTANTALVHPREVFQAALMSGAISIIVAHNHPSGQCIPSREDKTVTQKLKAASEVLEIKLLDHVIVTENECYSFKENGKL